MLGVGSSIGEALGEARRLFSAEPGIPIWAYYIHYGDPTYRFLDRKTRTSGYENAPATGGPKTLRDTTSFSVLGRSSNDEIRRTLEHYKSVITKNSADGEAHYALALCYLQLGLPELAIKNFQRTVELMPDYADAYYYYGLALIRGRRPKALSLAEVRRIEQYLDTALQLDPRQAKYYYLAAILKFDYYLSNGLTCNPSPDAFFLMAQDKEYDPWEVERLLHNVLLRDPDLVSKVRKNHETMKFA